MLNRFTILAALVWLIPLSQVLPHLVASLFQKDRFGHLFGVYRSHGDAIEGSTQDATFEQPPLPQSRQIDRLDVELVNVLANHID